jgi:hypothetical protein
MRLGIDARRTVPDQPGRPLPTLPNGHPFSELLA